MSSHLLTTETPIFILQLWDHCHNEALHVYLFNEMFESLATVAESLFLSCVAQSLRMHAFCFGHAETQGES